MIYLVLLAASVAIIFYVYKLFKSAGWITPPKVVFHIKKEINLVFHFYFEMS